MHLPPAFGDLGEHLVVRSADDVPFAQAVIGQVAAAHRQVAHLLVEHGDGRRRLIDKQAEQQPLPAHGLAQGVALADVAEHEHHPEQVAVRGEDGRGRIGDMAALAVPGDEDGVVGQGHRRPAGEHLLHRGRYRLAGAAVLERQHPVERLALCRRRRPAGEGFRRRVDQGHPAGRIRGHDPVADGLEDDGPVLEHGAGLGRGLEQIPVVGPLPALPGDERSAAGQGGQRGHQAEQQEDAGLTVGKGLGRVDLGHQEPGRVRDGQGHRLHLGAAVVPAAQGALAPLHGLHRDQFGLAQRFAQGEGRARPVAGVGQEQHRLAVPAHEQGFRGAAGQRPGVQLRKQEAGAIAEQQQAAEGATPPAGSVVQGHDHGRVGRLPGGVPVQVHEHRSLPGQGPLQHRSQPGGRVNGRRTEPPPFPRLHIHQADIAEAMFLGQGGQVAMQLPAAGRIGPGQEADHRVDQVGMVHEACAILELIGVPVGDLGRLEPGDGREFPGHLDPHTLNLDPVDPHAGREQGQHQGHRHGDSPPEPGSGGSGHAAAGTPEGRVKVGGLLGLCRFSAHDSAPPAWSSRVFARPGNPRAVPFCGRLACCLPYHRTGAVAPGADPCRATSGPAQSRPESGSAVSGGLQKTGEQVHHQRCRNTTAAGSRKRTAGSAKKNRNSVSGRTADGSPPPRELPRRQRQVIGIFTKSRAQQQVAQGKRDRRVQ